MSNLLKRFDIRHLYVLIPIAGFAMLSFMRSIGDASFLWHVRAGELQMVTGRVLAVDPFSFTAGGETWRTQSWLPDLVYAYLEATLGGVGWAPILVGVVGAATLAITGISAYGNCRDTVVTGIWVAIATWLLVPFAQPRPVVISYLLLASLVLVISRGAALQWTVVPILWVWSGVHGSWIIGLGLLTLWAIERRSPKLGLLLATSAATTALTAHGLGAWMIVSTFVRNAGALNYIQEWRPPDFADIAQAPYLLVVASLLVAAVVGRIQIRALWVVLPLLVFGLTSRRAVPVAALVLVPFASRWVFHRMLWRRSAWTPIPGLLAVAIAGLVGATLVGSERRIEPTEFPNDLAIEAVAGRRAFHGMAVGGYLIFRDQPGSFVYIDDRAELYGERRFADHSAALRGDYEGLFDRLDIEVAIVEPDWPLTKILLRNGWLTEYQDERFLVVSVPGTRSSGLG